MGTNVQLVPLGNHVGPPCHHVDYRSKAVVEVAARDLSAGLAGNVRMGLFVLEGHPRDVAQMGMRVDQSRREVAAGAVDHLFGALGALRKLGPDRDDLSIAHKHARRRGRCLSLRRDNGDVLDQEVLGLSSTGVRETSKSGEGEANRARMDFHWMALL